MGTKMKVGEECRASLGLLHDASFEVPFVLKSTFYLF